jgi:hypothetical protein
MTRLAPQPQGSVAPAGKEPSTGTIPAAADAVRRFRTSPTCAESRVECRKINALVEKSSLHFLQSCCGVAFFWRESYFVNENHARRRASMPKVVTTRSNRPRAPLNRLIRLTLGLAKFRKSPTNCASWARCARHQCERRAQRASGQVPSMIFS